MDIDFYRRATNELGRRVRAVTPQQWTAATPCTEWDVRAVVGHLTQMNLMIPGLLRGATWDEVRAGLPSDVLADQPARAWERSAQPSIDAFANAASGEAPVHLPQRDIPAAQFLLFRTNDTLVHAWDVARAIGADERLDAEVVDACYEHLKPAAAMLAASGLFAPVVPLPDPAPCRQAEYLALQGRNPL